MVDRPVRRNLSQSRVRNMARAIPSVVGDLVADGAGDALDEAVGPEAIPAGQRASHASLHARLTAALDRNELLADENARLRRSSTAHSATSGPPGPVQVRIQPRENRPSGRERPTSDTVSDGTPQVTALADAKLKITIESLNFQLRKITKNRGHFPGDDAAVKLLLPRDPEYHRTAHRRRWPGPRKRRARNRDARLESGTERTGSRVLVSRRSAFTSRRLQRLKGQGLWWLRVEGKAGLAEECVDEVGPALDGPEPGADHGLELVEGGGGVVAQAAFHD
jgi:hypothetical protein